MKTLVSGVAAYMGKRSTRRNTRLLIKLILTLVLMIAVYSVSFHLLMEREGQHHSWITGVYWTFTVMSTLGFGDITFETDLGRLYSILVMLSGVVFLLILMPFTLIEFFYAPWMERQSRGRLPDEVDEDLSGHVIITGFNSITRALVEKLERYRKPYVVICKDEEEGVPLLDEGISVMSGDPSRMETYERAGLARAALVTVTGDDVWNANTAFSIRDLSKTIPIVCTASGKAAADVIRLAGGTVAFQLGEMMGEALARRVVGGGASAHVIGRFDRLLIAEAAARGTALVDHTVAELGLRNRLGVNVIGVWERGGFRLAGPDTKIEFNSVMIVAGTAEQLERFDEAYRNPAFEQARVIVIGAGRVGQSVAEALRTQGIDYRIIELEKEALNELGEKGVQGDAAHFEVLQRAGIIEAESVVITSHNDDMDIYLTIFCRKLRPDIQIISRATHPENIQRLHRAGADIVLSYSSMGSNLIFNYLQKSDTLLIAEGLSVFRAPVPESLVGKNLVELALRASTGCNVIAVIGPDGKQMDVQPLRPLASGEELLLIGDGPSEKRLFDKFGES